MSTYNSLARGGSSCSTKQLSNQTARLQRPSSICRGVETRSIWNIAKGFGISFAPKVLNDRPELKPGKISPKLLVPAHIGRPPYADSGVLPPWSAKNQLHNAEGIVKLRAAGKLAAEVLNYAGTLIKAGVTTDSIDRAVHAMIIERGAYPLAFELRKVPQEPVHLGERGDILNVDITVFLNGYHGDTSRMYTVGQVAPEAQALCDVTKEALDAAIKLCGPGVAYNVIGKSIQVVADKHKYGVVRDYVGHGVGQTFHSGPTIRHNRNNDAGVMQLYQSFTIEPMLVQGSIKCNTWDDDWTVVTKDRGLCAQYEHTLLITPNGVEVMTQL
ncbi:MAG: hypothetical protein WDW36_001281 [Sanguina aurantia]